MIGQIFAYDCPIQSIECNLKGFNGSTTTQSFNTVLVNTINDYLTQKNIQITDCLVNTIQSNWYVNVKFNNEVIIDYLYFQGYGLNNGNFSAPTVDQWIQGVTDAFSNLQNYGLSYILNENGVVTVYNINCVPLNILQTFEINSSINFNILCNQ